MSTPRILTTVTTLAATVALLVGGQVTAQAPVFDIAAERASLSEVIVALEATHARAEQFTNLRVAGLESLTDAARTLLDGDASPMTLREEASELAAVTTALEQSFLNAAIGAVSSVSHAAHAAIQRAVTHGISTYTLAAALGATRSLPESAEAIQAVADRIVAETQALNEAVDAHEAELERQRKAAEEAARKVAAEKAAAASPKAPTVSTRTPQQAIAAAAASLPFNVGWTYVSSTSCGGVANPSVVLGCFMSESQTIYVTQRAVNQGHCALRETLAHEYRHQQQYLNGLFEWDNSGNLSNRNWLEADARAFEKKYSC